jgi:hypothetical protein
MTLRFDQHGNLPPGIHRMSVESVVEMFGSGSPERRVEIRELVQFIEWAKIRGVRRILVNGSFVTRKRCPNDVDLVVLPDFETGLEVNSADWPFLQILIAADDEDFAQWARRDFGTDRRGRAKGVVEVIL